MYIYYALYYEKSNKYLRLFFPIYIVKSYIHTYVHTCTVLNVRDLYCTYAYVHEKLVRIFFDPFLQGNFDQKNMIIVFSIIREIQKLDVFKNFENPQF